MSNMSCNELSQLLNESVENRSTLEERVLTAHTAKCDSCAALVDSHFLLSRGIGSWLEGVPDVDLTEAVLADLAVDSNLTFQSAPTFQAAIETPSDHVSRQIPSRGIALVLAAAVCLFVVAPLLFSPNGPQTIQTPTDHKTLAAIETGASHPASNPAVEPQPEINGLVRNMGTAYLGLAGEMQTTLNDAADLIPTVSFTGTEISVPKTNSGDPKPNSANTPEWTDDFKPIGKKVGKAFGFLLDAIPMNPANST